MNTTSAPDNGVLTGAERQLSGLGRLRAFQMGLVVALAALLVGLTAWSAIQLVEEEHQRERSDALQRELMATRDDAFTLQLVFWRRYVSTAPELRMADFRPTMEIRRRITVLAQREQEMDPDGPAARLGRRTVAAMDGLIATGFRYLQADRAERRRIVVDLLRSPRSPMAVAAASSKAWMDVLLERSRTTTAAQADRVVDLLVRVTVLLAVLVTAAVAGYIVLGRARARLVDRLHDVAREQAALRRLAMEVAEQRDPDALFAALAAEMAGLLDADAAFVCRCERGRSTVVGSSAPPWLQDVIAHRDTRRITPDSAIGRALATGAPVHLEGYGDVEGPLAAALHAAGVRAAVAAPVVVADAIWGAIVAVARTSERLPAGIQERLTPFARMAGVAIENNEVRMRLAQRATTDALTNLPNHGAFHERLAAEVARCAEEPRRRLALVVMDIDHFKAVNDTHGHPVGDRVLVEVAERLRGLCRGGEMLARVGGEEFAWILPDTDGAGAWAAAERAREAVGGTPLPVVGALTMSAGICVRESADDPAQMYHLADVALLHAKADGRDRAVRFDPLLMDDGVDPAGRQMERVRALDALRALARAVDARDRATQQHSQRVAEITYRLALRLGWEDDRARALREAALVHDVGKIGVADAVLRKGARLTPDEQEQIQGHAVLGARILAEVLTPEQVAWVRHHHERMDGSGYPDGLGGADIPEGARILAVADAWDAMTTDRPYRTAMSVALARGRLRGMAGAHLDTRIVHAMVAMLEAGADPTIGAGLHASDR